MWMGGYSADSSVSLVRVLTRRRVPLVIDIAADVFEAVVGEPEPWGIGGTSFPQVGDCGRGASSENTVRNVAHTTPT